MNKFINENTASVAVALSVITALNELDFWPKRFESSSLLMHEYICITVNLVPDPISSFGGRENVDREGCVRDSVLYSRAQFALDASVN